MLWFGTSCMIRTKILYSIRYSEMIYHNLPDYCDCCISFSLSSNNCQQYGELIIEMITSALGQFSKTSVNLLPHYLRTPRIALFRTVGTLNCQLPYQ